MDPSRFFSLKGYESCCENCLILVIGTYSFIFNTNALPAEIIKAVDRMQAAWNREHKFYDKENLSQDVFLWCCAVPSAIGCDSPKPILP